jgi:spermidine/putrescine transport system permease protein
MGRGLRWRGKLYLAGLYAFLFFPALFVVLFSFNASRFWAFPLRGLTLRWYEELIQRPDAVEAARNSLIVALPATAIALLLGGASAFAFHRWRFRLKSTAEGVVLLPQLLPTLIWGIALLLFLTSLGVTTGLLTVILGHVLLTTPYVLLLVTARYHSLDPNLENAARSLGASSWRIYRRILLPHLAPSLIASGLIAFAISFSDLIVAFLLSGGGFNTLPVFIYSLIQFEPSPVINAVASLVFGVAILTIAGAMLVGGREVAFLGKGKSRG